MCTTPRPLITAVKALVLLGWLAVHDADTAQAQTAPIRINNETYTPIRYRVRVPNGKYSQWWTLLPGKSDYYRDYPSLIAETKLTGDTTKVYRLESSQTYALRRHLPKGDPRFLRLTQRQSPPPAPPGEPSSRDAPFAPLEKFITACEKQHHTYRLSLRHLAEDCLEAQQEGELPDELRYLRGFTWFVGFIIDDQNDDIILLGIKDPSRPPIDIDCLVTAIKATYSRTIPSCSLDEHPDPKFQKSVIRGVDWNTLWALIMILADYDMKKLCQGHWDPSIPGFCSDFEYSNRILSSKGREGLGPPSKKTGAGVSFEDRWWFNFDSSVARSVADQTGNIVYLYKNPVRVSTEQNLNGKYGSGKTSLPALLFARDFTRHMDTLGKHYPSIAQLQALYRLYDLTNHIRDIGNTAPPAMPYWLEQYDPPYPGPPSAMPTLTRSRKVREKTRTGYTTTTWRVTGGVEMNVAITHQSLYRIPTTWDRKESGFRR